VQIKCGCRLHMQSSDTATVIAGPRKAFFRFESLGPAGPEAPSATAPLCAASQGRCGLVGGGIRRREKGIFLPKTRGRSQWCAPPYFNARSIGPGARDCPIRSTEPQHGKQPVWKWSVHLLRGITPTRSRTPMPAEVTKKKKTACQPSATRATDPQGAAQGFFPLFSRRGRDTSFRPAKGAIFYAYAIPDARRCGRIFPRPDKTPASLNRCSSGPGVSSQTPQLRNSFSGSPTGDNRGTILLSEDAR